MKRSRTYPATPKRVPERPDDDEDEEDEEDMDFLFAPAAAAAASADNATARRRTSNNNNNNTAALIHNIASFLTLSDAASLASYAAAEQAAATTTTPDSWAVGETLEEERSSGGGGCDAVGDVGDGDGGVDTSILYGGGSNWSFSSIPTPLTPALVALSPGATPRYGVSSRGGAYHPKHGASGDDDDYYEYSDDDSDDDDDDERMEELLRQGRRRWAQEKIINAVFSHPRSLRSFCLEAYTAANDIRRQKELAAAHIQAERELENDDDEPETRIEPTNNANESSLSSTRKRKRSSKSSRSSHKHKSRLALLKDWRAQVVHELVDFIFHNVPISVLLDVCEGAGVVVLESTGAGFCITFASLHHTVTALGRVLVTVWDAVTYCVTNPFALLEAIISLQFNAMGKTSEVLVSGIQSVATGVGSASSLALYKLSATNRSSTSLAGHMNRRNAGVDGGVLGAGGGGGAVSSKHNAVLNKRLLKKLSAMNDAALVVDYRENRGNDTCGLTRTAITRTRKMMHYNVSLRPFVATIAVPSSTTTATAAKRQDQASCDSDGLDNSQASDVPVASIDLPVAASSWNSANSEQDMDDDDEDGSLSPFMCTPQSFPPTPHSRQVVIEQRSLLSDDIVFWARDRLRVHDGTKSDDARTRERSQALQDGKRLAIFGCNKDSGIELTCGRHIATKVGNLYYASTRSVVSILRNCFVYFELTVLQRPVQAAVATLSIGLSTEEMPPNTLVGAWQGSVGLCTTGQILVAGQWCSPADPAMSAYGAGHTVGCLVCLDDESAFETWDGVMVKATTRFNINGVMVSPPVSTLPMAGAPATLPTSSSAAIAAAQVGSPTSERLASMGGGERLSPAPNLGSPPSRLEPPQATLVLWVPSAEDLYPTVTLQSAATSVVCRFSSEDISASTRDVIGAPPGVAVYAVDGSVILAEDQDSSSR